MKPARASRLIRALVVTTVAAGSAPARAAEAVAPDGEARGYERAPTAPASPARTVARGAGLAAGHLVRTVMLPVRGAAAVEGHWQVSRRAHDLFWNDAGTIGMFPAASWSSSTGATVGARGIYRNLFGRGEEIAAAADTGGVVVQSYQLRLSAPQLAGPLGLRGRIRYEENDGLVFQGIGNGNSGRAQQAQQAQVESQFAQQRWLAVLEARWRGGGPGRLLTLGWAAIHDARSFGDGERRVGVPGLTQVYDPATVPGFTSGTRNLELTSEVEIDTRDTPGPTGAGGVARGFAGVGGLLEPDQYAHYGAELAYHLTPFWPGRVIGARLALEGVRPLQGQVPFIDLPRLGGGRRLRGYRTGQFRDRLATVGTLEYRYPVHANLSGELFVETGKVAGSYQQLAGSGAGRWWHSAAGGGLVLHTPSRVQLRLDVAYGDGVHVFLGTDVLDAFRDREIER